MRSFFQHSEVLLYSTYLFQRYSQKLPHSRLSCGELWILILLQNMSRVLYLTILASEADISGRDKYLHPTVLFWMQLPIPVWDTCFWSQSHHLSGTLGQATYTVKVVVSHNPIARPYRWAMGCHMNSTYQWCLNLSLTLYMKYYHDNTTFGLFIVSRACNVPALNALPALMDGMFVLILSQLWCILTSMVRTRDGSY